MNTLRFKWNLLYVLMLDHFYYLFAICNLLIFKVQDSRCIIVWIYT